MGRMSDEELDVEARYLPKALELVRRLWPTHSCEEIATALQCQCKFTRADRRLVYGLKARLDRMDRVATD